MKPNYPAIVVAAVADFVLGAVWFTSLAKPWIADLRLTQEEITFAQQHMSPWPYTIAFLCSLLMAAVLSWLVMRTGEHTAVRGVCIGSAIGLLIAAGIVTELIFERHTASFIAIAAGYPFVGVTIMGAIVGAWRGKQLPIRSGAAGAPFEEATRPEREGLPRR